MTMEQENNDVQDCLALDGQKLKKIIKEIVKLENQNVKTSEFNDTEMTKKIAKIIEEVIKCY